MKPCIKDWSKIVICYEPLWDWSIRINANDETDQIEHAHHYIRYWVALNKS